MAKTLESRKNEIEEKIKNDGFIEKINDKEAKPYKQTTDVISAYDEDEVVLTWKNKKYTTKDIRDLGFDKIEYFIKPSKYYKMKKVPKTKNQYYVVQDKFGNKLDVLTIPNKANNNPAKARRIPWQYVLLKYQEEMAAVCVPVSTFFINPAIIARGFEKSLFGGFGDWVFKMQDNYTNKQVCDMVRYLASTVEFVGGRYTGKDYKTFGNAVDSLRIQRMSDEEILLLRKYLKELHDKEVKMDRLMKKDELYQQGKGEPLTPNEIRKLNDLDKWCTGRNEEIKNIFKISNRGALTDLRVWFTCMANGKNVWFTKYSKTEAIYVIPMVLCYTILNRLTSKKLEDVWKN